MLEHDFYAKVSYKDAVQIKKNPEIHNWLQFRTNLECFFFLV